MQLFTFTDPSVSSLIRPIYRLLLIFVLTAMLAITAAAASNTAASASGQAQYGSGGDMVTFQGIMTMDGDLAPANTQVVLQGQDGSAIAIGFTGSGGQAPGHYSFMVGGSHAPLNGSVVTLTANGFAEVQSVPVRYIYGATVTADIAAFTSPQEDLPEPGEGQAFIAVPQFVNISPEATATDSQGNAVQVIGGSLRPSQAGAPASVPVALAAGRVLETLDDPVSGITIRRTGDVMLIRIPIRDDEGNDTIRVLVETGDLQGTGFAAVGDIRGMSVDLPERSRDFSAFNIDVGVGSVKVLADIAAFPANASMEMNLLPEPGPSELARLTDTLNPEDEEVADIAFAVDFLKTGLDGVLQEVTLRLKVGKAWYDEQAGLADGRVIVVRLADDGTAQTFDFVPVDPQADPVQFNLVSPDGLSTFVITAVRKAQEPTPTPTATPTATPTPLPPTPTQAAIASAAPLPTAVPTPVAIATATASPTPTATPASTAASSPTVPPPTATTAPTSSGGSCNANGDGQFAAGNFALLISPLLLIVLRRKKWLS